jgi:predicted RNA binding protein YcfA (HicA-like mRNA interferase family)
MKDVNKEILKLAKRYGYALVRQTKHLIFKHPNGSVLVTGKSVSDYRASRNIEREIRKQLKLTTPPIDNHACSS